MRWMVLVSLVLGACYDPYDADDYWSELANAHCTAMEYCCTRAEYTDWWTDGDGDRQDCYQAHADAVFTDAIREGIRRHTIFFDEARAHACVSALENIACTQFEPAIRYRETYCESPFIGQIPDGDGTCYTDHECRSGHCGLDNHCLTAVAPGLPCSDTNGNPCDGGAYCHGGACTFGSPAGASCDSDSDCADDWCKGAGLFQDGTCVQACDGV
ncbi:MAG: hypothetical protein HOV81_39880 [Kofleriaceae bacterium]|nr:hypothetical protein [Kofleriaceae bacterium]